VKLARQKNAEPAERDDDGDTTGHVTDPRPPAGRSNQRSCLIMETVLARHTVAILAGRAMGAGPRSRSDHGAST